MKILVIGNGGREHALVWKLRQADANHQVYCAPGNAGIAGLATCVDIAASDIPGLLDFAQKEQIELTIVGPEAPLVAGIVDIFEAEGLRIRVELLQDHRVESALVSKLIPEEAPDEEKN